MLYIYIYLTSAYFPWQRLLGNLIRNTGTYTIYIVYILDLKGFDEFDLILDLEPWFICMHYAHAHNHLYVLAAGVPVAAWHGIGNDLFRSAAAVSDVRGSRSQK